MQLTQEQSDTVAENHGLIYWYINYRHLDEEDWYDLIAIELCKTVLCFDIEKGSLSNYFKIRCDNLLFKERLKQKSQKYFNNGIYPLSDAANISSGCTVEEQVDLNYFLQDDDDVMKLRVEGYTQSEIAEQLGLTQSYISKILAKKRAEYDS